ncbi:MAG: site-specific DNA-methyltransferase [Pirellulaceae bacterium]
MATDSNGHSKRAKQSTSSATATSNGSQTAKIAYKTKLGTMILGTIEKALRHRTILAAQGNVDLVLTSPPFPLVRKKRYGNETGKEYLEWLESLAPMLADLLSPTGSLVIELGNAWEKGSPTMSTLSLEALLAFKKAGELHLCQHVICHNPSRLPSPAEWVTVRRIRLKDSFTHVWWMSRTEFPKADNKAVLSPYGDDMKRLLAKQSYNAGTRPSGHRISEDGFLQNHNGSISANVLETDDNRSLPESLLKYSGASWNSRYRAYCKRHDIEQHPARMAPSLAGFFINFLTSPGDLVFDPFGGSNTTGAVAEELGRKWIAVEANENYVKGSRGRFLATS